MSDLSRKGISLYYQIMEYIEGKIERDEWKVGSQIPTEIELSELFKVSRSTVRQAISELVHSGSLIRQHGKGTFVAEPNFQGSFLKHFIFPKELGGTHKLLSFTYNSCSLSVAKRLGIEQGDQVIEIYRSKYLDDDPATLERSYFSSKLFPDIEKHDLSRNISEVLNKEYGLILKNKSMVEPVILNNREAALLEVSIGSPGLLLSRISYTIGEKPIVFTRTVVRHDKCRFLVID